MECPKIMRKTATPHNVFYKCFQKPPQNLAKSGKLNLNPVYLFKEIQQSPLTRTEQHYGNF